MTALIPNYKEFIGDGSRDAKGKTLEEFLLSYDPYKYKTPAVTADIVVLKEDGKEGGNTGLKVLLVKRKNHPCIGMWALPGGFAEMEESLEESAQRELFEETGVTGTKVIQLHTWGDPYRDPRGRVITVSFLAYLTGDVVVKAGDDAKEAAFASVSCRLLATAHTEEETVESYEISLSNEEAGIDGMAVVRVTTANKPLKNKSYEIVNGRGIDFDHEKIILNSLEKCL